MWGVFGFVRRAAALEAVGVMHVLIIESDTSFAASLDDALRSRGIGTTVTADGEAALALARSQRPAAVVLSLELGERLSAGFSWCNRFKRDDGLRSIPLILTSSLATTETFEHHGRLRTRADRYLHKPFPPEALIEALGSFLSLDGPPAGSDEDLADELLGDTPEYELLTLEADEITEIPIDESFSAGPTDALPTSDANESFSAGPTDAMPSQAANESFSAGLTGALPTGDANESFSAGPTGALPTKDALVDSPGDAYDLPSIPEAEFSPISVEDDGLDDLFVDLAPPVAELSLLEDLPAEDDVRPDLLDTQEPDAHDIGDIPDPERTVTEFLITDAFGNTAPPPSSDPSQAPSAHAPDALTEQVRRLEAELANQAHHFEQQRSSLLRDLEQARAAEQSAQRAHGDALQEATRLANALNEANLHSARLAAEIEALEEQGRSRAEAHQTDLQRREQLKELLQRALELL